MAGRPRVLPTASGDAIAPRLTHDTIDTITIILSISTTCTSTTTAIWHTIDTYVIVGARAIVGACVVVGMARVIVITVNISTSDFIQAYSDVVVILTGQPLQPLNAD